MPRSFFITVSVAALVGAGHASAEPNAKERAYKAAVSCFVANGLQLQARKRAGDQAGAARFDQSGKLAFDTAIKLGRQMGRSNATLNDDFDQAMRVEGPALTGSSERMRSALSICASMGL